VRWQSFYLLFRRFAVEGEIAVLGPLTIEVTSSFIFGAASETSTLDEKGFTLGGDVAVYLEGTPLRGFYVKTYTAYESFKATLTHPDFPDDPVQQSLSTAVIGALAGATMIVGPHGGRDGGFILSGGVGLGVATAAAQKLRAPSDPASGRHVDATYFDGAGRLRVLGSLGLGVVF
jgi:hypothetical protein